MATDFPGRYWEPGEAPYRASRLIRNIRIPIRDGMHLNAVMYVPCSKESGKPVRDERFPTVVEWTCYSFIPPAFFTSYGYIYLMVWMEGTGGSDGEIRMGDPVEGTDATFIIDWIEGLEQADGRVAFIGASAPAGMALLAASVDNRISCVIANNNGLQNCVRQSWFMSGVATVGGMYYTQAIPSIYGRTKAAKRWSQRARRDMEEGTGIAYDGEYWKDRLPMRFAESIVNNGVPVLMSSGYRDIMDNLVIKTWCAFQNAHAGKAVDGKMDPDQKVSPKWQLLYGSWGHMHALNRGLELQWLETWVRGMDTGLQSTANPLHIYEGGSGRWSNLPTFPQSRQSDQWFIDSRNSLSLSPDESGSFDLRFAYPDEHMGLASFASNPLEDDYVICGALSMTLFASTTTTNIVVIATLFDEGDNQKTEVARGVVLGSQSELDADKSWFDENGTPTYVWAKLDKDVYLESGRIYGLSMNMACRQWRFKRGHRLTLELTTKTSRSLCPPKGPMPGNHCLPGRYNEKQNASMENGVFTIYFGEAYPSAINVPSMKKPLSYVDDTGCLPPSLSASFSSQIYDIPLDWCE